MMYEEDVRPPNEKLHAYHLSITYHACGFCLLAPPAIFSPPQMPIYTPGTKYIGGI